MMGACASTTRRQHACIDRFALALAAWETLPAAPQQCTDLSLVVEAAVKSTDGLGVLGVATKEADEVWDVLLDARVCAGRAAILLVREGVAATRQLQTVASLRGTAATVTWPAKAGGRRVRLPLRGVVRTPDDAGAACGGAAHVFGFVVVPAATPTGSTLTLNDATAPPSSTHRWTVEPTTSLGDADGRVLDVLRPQPCSELSCDTAGRVLGSRTLDVNVFTRHGNAVELTTTLMRKDTPEWPALPRDVHVCVPVPGLMQCVSYPHAWSRWYREVPLATRSFVVLNRAGVVVTASLLVIDLHSGKLLLTEVFPSSSWDWRIVQGATWDTVLVFQRDPLADDWNVSTWQLLMEAALEDAASVRVSWRCTDTQLVFAADWSCFRTVATVADAPGLRAAGGAFAVAPPYVVSTQWLNTGDTLLSVYTLPDLQPTRACARVPFHVDHMCVDNPFDATALLCWGTGVGSHVVVLPAPHTGRGWV